MPCEYIVCHGLPILRKKIAESMINNYGLNQRETAKRLCITPAAVSQYLSGKRGELNIIDKEINREINRSAERIIRMRWEEILVSETCRLCKIFKSKNLFRLIIKKRDVCEIL